MRNASHEHFGATLLGALTGAAIVAVIFGVVQFYSTVSGSLMEWKEHVLANMQSTQPVDSSNVPAAAVPGPSYGNITASASPDGDISRPQPGSAIETRERDAKELDSAKGFPDDAGSKYPSVDLLWDKVGNGNVSAELTLADLYAEGFGVEKNCDQARVLLQAAEAKGIDRPSQRLVQMIRQTCW